LREQLRKPLRKVANVRLPGIGDALALADLQSLEFPFSENGLKALVIQAEELFTQFMRRLPHGPCQVKIPQPP